MGSIFTFTLPVQGVQLGDGPPTPMPAVIKRARSLSSNVNASAGTVAKPTALRCLFADDHDLNLRLVKRLLEMQGLEVTTARDGKEAYSALLDSYAAGAPPHGACSVRAGEQYSSHRLFPYQWPCLTWRCLIGAGRTGAQTDSGGRP